MNERRHNPRYTTEQALEAYDVHSARFLGRFVDTSEDGFLLFCPHAIDADSIWQIRVLEANDLHLRSLVSFGAECLWVRQADDNNHYWAGFHIIDISAQDNEILRALFCSPE
jgi:hypothetical protein